MDTLIIKRPLPDTIHRLYKEIKNPIPLSTSTPNPVPVDPVYRDTTLIFEIKGKQIVVKTRYLYVNSILNQKHGIDSVAKKWGSRNLDSTLVLYRDVTGDGKPEKLVSHLFHVKKPGSDTEAFMVTHLIYKGKELIYHDTLNYNEDCPEGEGAPVIDALYPYSYFEELLEHISMCYKFNLAEFNKMRQDYLSDIEGSVLGKYLDSHEDEDSLINYIRHFNGYLVTGSSCMDDWTDIWYEPEHRFVHYAGP